MPGCDSLRRFASRFAAGCWLAALAGLVETASGQDYEVRDDTGAGVGTSNDSGLFGPGPSGELTLLAREGGRLACLRADWRNDEAGALLPGDCALLPRGEASTGAECTGL